MFNQKWLRSIGLLYLLPAFIWWAFLLWNKNEEVFLLQREMVRLTAHHFTEVDVDQQLTRINNELSRQRRMILGEGFVFFTLLGAGVFYIRKSFKREVELAEQQRNFQLSVTHELKSPIAAIQLSCETLLKRDLSSEVVEKITRNTLKDTKRLNKLVEDILLSASLEDVWKPNKEEVDLMDLVEDSVSTVRRIYKNAELSYANESNVMAVNVDKNAFRAVLQNLIENAIKYNHLDDPKCHVRVRLNAKNAVEIDVIDNGPGIPANERKRIFNKFYRIGNEDTRSAKGTGLGLYIVQKVMQAHGGNVSVINNLPTGSRFTLTFGKA